MWRWYASCFCVGLIAASLGLHVDQLAWWTFVLSFDTIIFLILRPW